MTDLRKAAGMALVALNSFDPHDDELWYSEKSADEIDSAITALRQALTQPEQKGHCTCGDPEALGVVHFRTRPCIYYTEPLAQPEQEPEWIDDGFGTIWQKCGKKDCGKFVVKIGKVDCWNGDCPETTAPPKREWVGLAKEEKFKVLKEFFGNSQQMIDAVEAKLKEKNA